MAFDPKDASLFQHHRAFSPELAKWVQPDMGYVDGLNYYTFDGENPINAVNPLGT